MKVKFRTGPRSSVRRATRHGTGSGRGDGSRLAPSAASPSGVDALTPSELRVVRLAAECGSNREIAQALYITTKTVGAHLGSSYSKLEITSCE